MQTALLKDSLWVLGTRLVMRGANFVVFILLARVLTEGEFGFYGYVMSTALVLSVGFDLGLRQSTAFFVGREPENATAVATHLLFLWCLLAALAALVCWLMLSSGGYTADFGPLALVGALGTAPMLLLRMGQGIFLGRGNLKALNQSELISRAVMLLGSLGLWATGRLDVATAIWTLLVAHGLASLYLLVQVRRDVRPRTLLDPALVRRMLGHGFVFASATILMIALGRVGIWIVSDLMGPAALGRYFGVQRLGEILVEVATAVGVVIFSHGVRAADIRASAGDAIRIARLVTALMAAVGLFCILAAQPLLRLTLGPEFAAEAPAFRLIMVGTLANCFTTMLFPCLSSQGLARVGTAAFALGIVVAALACWGLVPPLGLAGAGIANILAQGAVVLIIVLAYRSRFGFRTAEILLPQREDAAAILGLARRLPAHLRRPARG
jgi:O-antigen/teichoic acid export membrane protein